MSRRKWALVAILILVNYIVFASLILFVVARRPNSGHEPTRTPQPTFTTVPSPTVLVLPPTNTVLPSPTATPVLQTPEPPTSAATLVSSPSSPTQVATVDTSNGDEGKASVTVAASLNVRAGPGTDYPVVGSLAAGATVEILGRNSDSTWWQIPYQGASGDKAWISAGYGEARNTDQVPVVKAPQAPPKPTSPPAPEATATPQFQYSPTGWEGHYNAGLAQIRGHIRDAGGNPVKGVFVQAKCGGTVIASNPSGVNLYAPGEGYEAGAYDIILSSPLSTDSFCNWEVRVVEAATYEEAQNSYAAAVSPVAYCDLTWDEANPLTICFADWRKNW